MEHIKQSVQKSGHIQSIIEVIKEKRYRKTQLLRQVTFVFMWCDVYGVNHRIISLKKPQESPLHFCSHSEKPC